MPYPLTLFGNPRRRRRRPRRNGRSRTPAYRVEFDGVSVGGRPVYMTATGWDVKEYGRATAANLERYIIALGRSTAPGGPNAHLGETIIHGARLIRQRGGAVVATYNRDDSLADQVWELQHGPRRNGPRRSRRNPETLPTQHAVQQSERVYEIKYKHVEDGEDYVHSFAPGTCMELLADGSVRLYRNDGQPLFRNFV